MIIDMNNITLSWEIFPTNKSLLTPKLNAIDCAAANAVMTFERSHNFQLKSF